MPKIDEPEVMPPCDFKTSHGVYVRLSPKYKNGPGVPTGMVMTLPDVALVDSPSDHIDGTWNSHEEAFSAGSDAAERWVEFLIKSKKILQV